MIDRTSHGRLRGSVAGCVVGAVSCCISGCGWSGPAGYGNVGTTSTGQEPVRLEISAETALFRYQDRDSLTMILSDIPVEDLRSGNIVTGQVLCLTFLWNPRAGFTPIDPNATNCTVRQVLFTESGVGLYGGGGFLYPNDDTTDDRVGGTLEDSTMRLIAATKEFSDLLGTAKASGALSVERSDEAVEEIMIQVNSEVSRRLGRVYLAIGD